MFLGVDQSLNATGLCVLSRDPDAPPVVLTTVDPGKLRGVERLRYVKTAVGALLTTGVQFVSFEGYSYDSVGRVFELGEVGGVLKLLAFEAGIPFIIVPPSSLKKFATGNSAADKAAMLQAANQHGCAAADDNQADAFFLSLVARYIHTKTVPPIRARYEVLRKLIMPATKRAKPRVRQLVKNHL